MVKLVMRNQTGSERVNMRLAVERENVKGSPKRKEEAKREEFAKIGTSGYARQCESNKTGGSEWAGFEEIS
jgi:hypothetical protein